MLINIHEGGTSSQRNSKQIEGIDEIEKDDNGDVDVPPPAYEPIEERSEASSSSKRRQSRRKSSRRGEGGLWIIRYNPIDYLQDFCEARLESPWFWALIFFNTLVEPVLCSYRPNGIYFKLQLLVLMIGSVLFVIQLIGSASKEWDQIMMEEFVTSENFTLEKAPDILTRQLKQLSVTKIILFFTSEGEFMLDFGCLALGWALLFTYPGVAVLRCFRVFRLLWFYQIEPITRLMHKYMVPCFGAEFVIRALKVMKFAVKSLSALGNEMFRLTNETRGGFLLMAVFFYSAWVLGTVIYWEVGYGKNADDDSDMRFCDTLSGCTFTMMRLTFFDGDGFDLAFYLIDDHPILFVITMLYMCLTSFGLLNGLVGIFGTAFAKASQTAFEEELDIESFDIQQDQEIESVAGGSQDASVANNEKNQFRFSSRSDGIDAYVEDEEDDESVDVFTSLKPIPVHQTAGGSGGGANTVSAFIAQTAAVSEDNHQKYAPARPNESSASIDSNPSNDSLDGSVTDKPKKQRKSLRDTILKHNIGNVQVAIGDTSGSSMALSSNFVEGVNSNLTASANSPHVLNSQQSTVGQATRGGLKSRPSMSSLHKIMKEKQKVEKQARGLGPTGLFGGGTRAYVNNASAANVTQALAKDSGVPGALSVTNIAASVKSIESNIHSLSHKVDKQTENISKMVHQMEDLTQALHRLHPMIGEKMPHKVRRKSLGEAIFGSIAAPSSEESPHKSSEHGGPAGDNGRARETLSASEDEEE